MEQKYYDDYKKKSNLLNDIQIYTKGKFFEFYVEILKKYYEKNKEKSYRDSQQKYYESNKEKL